MKYSIAGYITELNNCGDTTLRNAKKYICDDNLQTEIFLNSDINEAKKRYPNSTDTDALYLWEGYLFCLEMFKRGNMRLHSSCVVVDNKAYLFSAPCGTGKSTHTNFWLELFGDRAYILNDDKPIIKFIDSKAYAFGSPWSGKNDISVNNGVPIQGICFLERADKNHIKKVSGTEALILMISGCLKRLSKENAEKQLQIVKTIIDFVPIYKMGCLPNLEAAKISYQTMCNEN